MDVYTLLYLKWITNKEPLYGTLLTVIWQPGWRGGEFEGEWIHGSVWLSPFLVHLKLSQIIGCTPIQSVSGVKKVKTHMCHEEPTGLWAFSRQGLLENSFFLYLSSKTRDQTCALCSRRLKS